MKAKYIIDLLDEFAPDFLIDSWDNTGFQIGNSERDVRKILLSLDVDEKVLDYGLERDIDMIISHHPLIFSPINTITDKTKKGSLIYRIIREDLVIYNAHTNLDQTDRGVNDVLADLFELKDREILQENIEENGKVYGYGRVGDIDGLELMELVDKVKEKLATERVTVYGDIDRKIERLALCGGSGASFIESAARSGADVYLTGDIKYHDAQEAVEQGLVLIDAGHYHTEKVVLDRLKEVIEASYGDDIEIDIYRESSPNYRIY